MKAIELQPEGESRDPYNLWMGLKVIPEKIPYSLKCLDQ